MQRIFIKTYFLFTVESVCRVKQLTTASRNSLKDVSNSQMIPDQVPMWLRQQSEDIYDAGIDALLRRWDKCINVGGGCFEK
jgi:hypothetical protein